MASLSARRLLTTTVTVMVVLVAGAHLLQGVLGEATTTTTSLLGSETEAKDAFGSSVSLHLDAALVGARRADQGVTGAAYVFVQSSDGTWAERARLTAPEEERGPFDWFGRPVLMADDLALVGAPGDSGAAEDSGAVYAYETTSETGWTLAGKIVLDDGRRNDAFGGGLAHDQTHLVVGAIGRDTTGGTDSGAAYLFKRTAEDEWTLQSRILGESAKDRAGFEVAIPGDLTGDGAADLVVGAPLHEGDETDTGAIYVVAGPLGGLDSTVSLANADVKIVGADGSDLAGTSVASAGDINGDGVVDLWIGADEADPAGTAAGAAYLVQGPLEGRVSLAEAEATYTGEVNGDRAGATITSIDDINDDGVPDVAVGAPGHDQPSDDAGAVYLATSPHRGEVSLADAAMKLTGDKGDTFGKALASDAGQLLVGAPRTDTQAGNDTGAAYVYDLGYSDDSGDTGGTSGNDTDSGSTDGNDTGNGTGTTNGAANGSDTTRDNASPEPSFTFSPSAPQPGATVTFTSQSDDPDGAIVAWNWTFGDGTSGTGANATHLYEDAGRYQVTLTVTDDNGTTNRTSREVVVSSGDNEPPYVNIRVLTKDPVAGQGIQLKATGRDPDGSVVARHWTFGDGTTADGATVNHTYAQEGVYEVRVTVLDDDGARAWANRSLTIGTDAGSGDAPGGDDVTGPSGASNGSDPLGDGKAGSEGSAEGSEPTGGRSRRELPGPGPGLLLVAVAAAVVAVRASRE